MKSWTIEQLKAWGVIWLVAAACWAGSLAAADDVFDKLPLWSLDTAPVRMVEPVYPELAQRARIQGVVEMEVVIAKDGTVEAVRAVKGHPLLVPAAIDAIKQWVWKPITLNGKPIRIRTVLSANFELSHATVVLVHGTTTVPSCSCNESTFCLTEAQMATYVKHLEMKSDRMGKHVNVRGSAVFELVIGKDGHVVNGRAFSGHALAIPLLMEAMPNWQFKPYLRQGVAQQVCGRLRLNFSVVDNVSAVYVEGRRSGR